MRPARGWRRVFRHEPNEHRVDTDVDAELRFHFEMTVRELMAHGMTPDEARREAERRFGDLERTRDTLRRIDQDRVGRERRVEALSAFMQDVRYAARTLRSSPGFALTVVLTLGLGIGANAMMFGIVDRLLLRGPAHIVDAENVRRVYVTVPEETVGRNTDSAVGYVLYATLRDNAKSLDGVAAYAYREITLGRGARARRIPAAAATWDLFSVLGVRAEFGRFFTADEDRPPAGQRVTVISHEFWQRELGARRDAIGSTVVYDNVPYTIVGIAPPGFTGPELHAAEAWIPMSVYSQNVTSNWTRAWNAQWLRVVARVRPSMTDKQIHDDLTSALRNAYTGKDKSLRAGEVDVRPLWFDRGGKPSAAVDVSRWLLGVAMVVLLIACANVANLLLARGVTRRREIAVRLALGISRGRLIRLLLAESTALAVVGGVVAAGVAYAGGRLMQTTLLHDIAWPDSAIDPRLLAFTALVAITTGLVVGVLPALRSSRPNLVGALVGSARGGVALRSRLRTALVVTQAALSVILLVGAGLFVRSLWNVRSLDHGFQPERVIVARMSWPSTGGGPDDAEHVRQKLLIRRALERAQRMPEVEHASIAVGTPFISGFSVDLKVPGRDSIPNLAGGGPYVSAVTSDYFATVGARLIRGRVFGANEGQGTERVVVVNQTMARTLWLGEDAIGKCVITGDNETRCSQVVGIVADARRFGLREKPAMQYYVPFGQESGFGGSAILVRPKGSLGALLEPVRRMLVEVAPDILYARVETLQDNLDPQIHPWRLGATMFGIFGGLAMIVAAIGLYSVIAYAVTQRRQELGVRVALGARTANIVGLVVRSGMGTALAGVAIGIVAALLAGRFIESLLFDTSSHDPLVFAVVAAVLGLVSLMATLVPAGRAARVDPATVLRAD